MALPTAKIFNPFRGKPLRRLQREINQRRFTYPNRNILVVGQPKSGSTWLFNMLREIPGYLQWTPNYIKFEKHDLHDDWYENTPAGYTVTKTHTRPTEQNRRIIHQAGRPYVVLLRDLRDIAVSWSFYVGNTPDHPRHTLIQPLTTEARLDYFIETMLPEFVFWSTNWFRHIDPTLGHLVRYEDMLADTTVQMRTVLNHFGLEHDSVGLDGIVDRHRFEKKTGRKPGEEDASQFNRKGIAGDWANHLTDHHRKAFQEMAGEALVELGYETTQEW